MNFFSSSDQLKAVFGDLDGQSFYDPVPLTDTEVGFSVKRKYPSDIRFKPAVRQKDGEPDTVAVLWVVYMRPKSGEKNASYSRVPVRVRVGLMSQYLASHFDYNYEDVEGGCPSKASVEASLSTPKPITLDF